MLDFAPDEKLEAVEFPDDLDHRARAPERRVNFDCEWTLPAMIKLGGDKLCSWEDGPFKQLYDRLLPTRGDGDIIHRCGGYPENIQGDMRLECQLVSHGLYCGDASGYKDPRCPILEKGASDWKLLLQVDSDHKRFRWMWGDAGRVYFWARQQDIESADFSSAWTMLQCG